MRLFYAQNPSACGIVELDKNNKIIQFEEKPLIPKSNLANGGIYVTDRRIFNFISKEIICIHTQSFQILFITHPV